ncbi:DUF3108 domain-containing protein [Duganella sp. Leaf126]|uniref:DUF3108 domain-containing protein n=1 Tax=Duganella sp. Leaf126 TaxID=1736266 RepID=UPI001E4932AA|nr:DUF3108 domain-containing protein [Duganella sp. Leaf126]
MFSGTCALAAEQRPPAAAPTPAVGDNWTYQYTDARTGVKGNISRLEVSAIDTTGVHVDILRPGAPAPVGKQLFSADMNPIDRGSMHFAPSFARYAFPLTPGKEWTSEAVADNVKLGKQWRYDIKGKVLDWEKIKVPAGEFHALKVIVEADYRGKDTGPDSGNGNLVETVWFVPELNNFVKLDYRDSDWQGRTVNRDGWELLSYGHKAASPAAPMPPAAPATPSAPAPVATPPVASTSR